MENKFSFSRAIQNFLFNQTTLITFIIILVLAFFLNDRFYTVNNITNIFRQSVPLGIVALGLLFVILTGGIDLSVGSIMALVSVIVAIEIHQCGVWASVGLGLLSGLVIGLLSGSMVAYFRIAPFIATLATMTIARGLAQIVSKAQPIFIDEQEFVNFGSSNFLGIPYPFWVLILATVIAWLVHRQTVFGRLTVAIGSNETATRFSGIKISLYKLAVYGVCGFMCAVAGIISATRTGVGSPILAIGFELDAIAAVVVGGASLSGGKGKVSNTIIGVFVLAIISNLMNLMNISGYYQQVVKGVIIALAVLLDSLKQRNSK